MGGSFDFGKSSGSSFGGGFGHKEQEEQQKNDLYAKQKARLAAAKSELTAEEDEEKAQETVLKLQSQEREVRSSQIKTEEKLLAMQNGQTPPKDDKAGSDSKKSSLGGLDTGGSNLRSNSFSEGGGSSSGFNFGGSQPQDGQQPQQQESFNFG